MARYTRPVCRLCRREGQKLFLKGTKCFTEKCPVERRAYAPGQHGAAGQRRKKASEYAHQLRENYFLPGFFLPAMARRGPFLVRALVCVRWPRTGKPRR